MTAPNQNSNCPFTETEKCRHSIINDHCLSCPTLLDFMLKFQEAGLLGVLVTNIKEIDDLKWK